MRRGVAAGIVLIASMGACATPSRQAVFAPVSQEAEERLGHHIHWNQGGAEDEEVARQIAVLLRAPLTVDSAIDIALLNNPGLQAMFEALGVSQADLVQAGRIRNPSLGVSVLFPQSPGAVVDYGFSLTQEVLDLILLPVRKRVAASDLSRAQLRVTEAVLDLAARTRIAFLRLQAAQQIVALQKTIHEAATLSGELARRQQEAGNISELDAIAALGAGQQAAIDLSNAELDEESARLDLNRLLGAEAIHADWSISGMLPEIPAQEPAVEDLVASAVARRPDLEAARKNVIALEYALSLARGTAWLGSLDVGVATERDAENLRVTGPTFQIELPIFDQHEAQVARLEALHRQSMRQEEDLTLSVRAEVRSVWQRLLTIRDIASRYRREIIPQREHLMRLSQERYNLMLLGVHQLLFARQAEATAYRDYILAVRDYWIARADLARAIGGRVEARTKAATAVRRSSQ